MGKSGSGENPTDPGHLNCSRSAILPAKCVMSVKAGQKWRKQAD